MHNCITIMDKTILFRDKSEKSERLCETVKTCVTPTIKQMVRDLSVVHNYNNESEFIRSAIIHFAYYLETHKKRPE